MNARLKRLILDLQKLDRDLLEAFRQKLRVRWTHSATALESNTLDEGETLGVLHYGLTISGKPLSHHNEVLGHSRALDLILKTAIEERSEGGYWPCERELVYRKFELTRRVSLNQRIFRMHLAS